MSVEAEVSGARAEKLAFWALAAAGLGMAAVAFAYWLVIPAVVLGVLAIVLGVMARRSGDEQKGREMATIAVTLGVVAVLMTPVVLMQTKGAEDWGRDCALNPTHDPNC